MKIFINFLFTLLICVQNIDGGYYVENYYFSHPLTANWWGAVRFCNFYGNQLIDIPDEREYRRILKVIASVVNDSSMAPTTIWTSGTRFPEEKSYYWINTGMPIMYADWSPTEPRMTPGEKCVFMFTGGQLDDGGCENKKVFICRVPSRTVPPIPETSLSRLLP